MVSSSTMPDDDVRVRAETRPSQITEASSHEVRPPCSSTCGHVSVRDRGPIVAVVRQREAGLEEDVTASREHRAVGEAWPVRRVAYRWLLSSRGRRPHEAEAGEGGESARSPRSPDGVHYFTPTTWRIMPSVLVST